MSEPGAGAGSRVGGEGGWAGRESVSQAEMRRLNLVQEEAPAARASRLQSREETENQETEE